MTRVIRPLSAEVAVTTASTVSSASLVRAYAANTAVVTVKESGGATLGSFTIVGGTTEFVSKTPTDTIEATLSTLCTSIAYT